MGHPSLFYPLDNSSIVHCLQVSYPGVNEEPELEEVHMEEEHPPSPLPPTAHSVPSRRGRRSILPKREDQRSDVEVEMNEAEPMEELNIMKNVVKEEVDSISPILAMEHVRQAFTLIHTFLKGWNRS